MKKAMNSFDDMLKKLFLQKIACQIQKYCIKKNWEKKKSKRDYVAIFFICAVVMYFSVCLYKDDAIPTEILLPIDNQLADYEVLVINAIRKIAKQENRDIQSLLEELIKQ